MSKKIKRVGIFIDGGHLSVAVKKVFSKVDSDYWRDRSTPINRHFPESKIDYEKLTAKIGSGQEIVYRAFYTCPPIREKDQNGHLLAYDERWFAYKKFKRRLKAAKYEVREGFLLEHPKFEQKGVDTFIAWDIATLVAQNCIDQICLVTGDGDFLPVVQCAKKDKGVSTTLWYARRKTISKRLEKACHPTAYNLAGIIDEIRR